MTASLSQDPSSAGLLIVGHGTRDEHGQQEFAQVVREVAARRPGLLVEGSFLELVEPDIAGGIAKLVERGAKAISVVPLLLVAAGHARRDIPRQLALARQRFPGAALQQTAHIGAHEALLAIAQDRYTSAVGELAPDAVQRTLLLVVGRGTKDPAANAELCHFARLRWEQTRVGWLETCFLAMTEPSLEKALEIVPRLPFDRVVVEPHFLFAGELLDRASAMVRAAAERWRGGHIVMAGRLAPDGRLADAVIDLSDKSL